MIGQYIKSTVSQDSQVIDDFLNSIFLNVLCIHCDLILYQPWNTILENVEDIWSLKFSFLLP